MIDFARIIGIKPRFAVQLWLAISALIGIAVTPVIIAAQDAIETEAQAAEKIICSKLDTFDSLNKLSSDKDIVFIILPGDDEKLVEKSAPIMEQAAQLLKKDGIKSASYFMTKESADYKKVVESFGVEKFPVVLAVAKGCGKAALVEEITAEKLVEGYKKAVKPGCNPNACYIKRK
jgi:hypothetical protein